MLTAAGLKIYGLNVAPYAQFGWLSSTSVQFVVLEWEIVLGVWLLTGRKTAGAWFAAVATFLAFAGVSSYLGVIGQASCGCFGSIEASPWLAFAVDGIALILLGLGRPDFQILFAQARWQTVVMRGLGSAVGVVAIFAIILSAAALGFGSLDAGLARLRGDVISIQPAVLDVGHGQPSETVAASVEVINRTASPVRILGGTFDCSCGTTENLPLTLAPGEGRRVSVYMRLPAEPGFFNRKALLRTDCDDKRTILFGISGRVDPPARAATSDTTEK